MDKIQSFQFGTVLLVCVDRFKPTSVIDPEFTCISIKIEVQLYDISNPLTLALCMLTGLGRVAPNRSFLQL
jgi:hypothetical protein